MRNNRKSITFSINWSCLGDGLIVLHILLLLHSFLFLYPLRVTEKEKREEEFSLGA